MHAKLNSEASTTMQKKKKRMKMQKNQAKQTDDVLSGS